MKCVVYSLGQSCSITHQGGEGERIEDGGKMGVEGEEGIEEEEKTALNHIALR